MSDEIAFLDALRTDPTDATLLLVYADWLEERGDPRAEYIRLTQAPQYDEARIEALRRQFDAVWVSFVDERGKQLRNRKVRAELMQIDREWDVERSQHFRRRVPAHILNIEDYRGVPALLLLTGFFLTVGAVFFALRECILRFGFFGGRFADVFFWLGLIYPLGCLLALVGILTRQFRYRRALRAYQQRRAEVVARSNDRPPA